MAHPPPHSSSLSGCYITGYFTRSMREKKELLLAAVTLAMSPHFPVNILLVQVSYFIDTIGPTRDQKISGMIHMKHTSDFQSACQQIHK